MEYLGLLIFRAHSALAAGLLPPGTGSSGDEPVINPYDLVTWINNAKNFILALGGVIAVAMFIYSGVLFITAAGNTDKLTKAKGFFVAAVVGVVLILLSEALVFGLIEFLQ